MFVGGPGAGLCGAGSGSVRKGRCSRRTVHHGLCLYLVLSVPLRRPPMLMRRPPMLMRQPVLCAQSDGGVATTLSGFSGTSGRAESPQSGGDDIPLGLGTSADRVDNGCELPSLAVLPVLGAAWSLHA